MSVLYMLGPQRPRPNLRAVVDKLVPPGERAAVITAGWQDREGDIADMAEEARRPLVDLGIYRRAEEALLRDPALNEAHRLRQDKLKELQRLYQMRLHPAMRAARRLLRAQGDPELLNLERRAAITQLRALDRHHLRRIAAIHDDFSCKREGAGSDALAESVEAIRSLIDRSAAVLIAGGHVAVLLNRMRLFGLGPMLSGRPVIAWSAGAMVLGERVVLFHDNATQGPRDAEVFDAGLGLVSQVLPLPDARHRVDFSDRHRLAIFSRRFAPSRCLTLDNGALLAFDSDRITAAHDVRRVSRAGRARRFHEA